MVIKKNAEDLTCYLQVFIFVLGFLITGTIENSKAQPAYHWKNVAIGGGGYVTGLVIHPKEKGLAYIRTDVGGFYRWNNLQEKWIPITDHFDYTQSGYYGGESIALDPNDPDVVYIAAGSSYRSGTIFKSKDCGETWIKSDLETPMHGNGDLRWAGERIAVDPYDSQVILFGSRREGLFKSTDDGLTWKSIGKIGNPTENIGILCIVFDPTTRGTVYANVYGDGIYESLDGGNTWRILEGSPSGVLRMSIDSQCILYTAGRTEPKVAKKKTDGTWVNITPLKFRMDRSNPTSTRMVLASFNFCGISVDPNNSNHIVLGIDYKMPGKMYRSLDGGNSWVEVEKQLNKTVPWWQDDYWGGAMAALVIDPHSQGKVWFTDWFGVWRTDDISADVPTWSILGSGLEEICLTSLIAPPAASSSSGYMLMCGSMDICGLVHYDLEKIPESKIYPTYQHTWDLDYCANNPSHVVRIGSNTAMNFFGDYIVSTETNTYGGAISTDEGLTWVNFPSMPVITDRPINIAISATDPNLFIMLSRTSAHRTQDGGKSWEKIELPLEESGKLLVADKVNGQKFYYYNKGKLYRSTDGGKTFIATKATFPGMNSGDLQSRINAKVKSVPGIEGEIWIGLGTEGLYRSSDSGSSFSKIKSVNRVLLFAFGKPLKRMSEPVLYLYGTVDGKDGVFRSFDSGNKWQDITPKNEVGIGCRPVVMEASKEHAGLVFIATSGRGIFYGIPEDFMDVR
jgi:xyloglucan-specific exo-beta-1,4-glucanase